VLVGHSCGATLAFQNLLSSQFPCQKPCAVLGVEGIYDLPALRDHFKDVPIYQEILAGAFGEDEELWKKASPTHGNLAESWKEGKLVCIAHSKEDSMVDTGQALGMMAALKDSASHGMREDRLLWIEREHDDVWQQGDSLAKSVRFVLDVLETK
jgi:kynurenine formamidase